MIKTGLLYLLLGLFGGFIFGLLWEFITGDIIKTSKYAHVGGYHFHHTLFGLIAFLFADINRNNTAKLGFYIGFGIGVIAQHTISYGFVFISKGRA